MNVVRGTAGSQTNTSSFNLELSTVVRKSPDRQPGSEFYIRTFIGADNTTCNLLFRLGDEAIKQWAQILFRSQTAIKILLSFISAAAHQPYKSPLHPGVGEFRVKLNSMVEVIFSKLDIILGYPNSSSIDPGLSIAWRELDSPIVVTERPVKIPLLLTSRAPLPPAQRKIRFEFDRFGQIGDRAVQVTEIELRHAAVGEYFGVAGIEFDRSIEIFNGSPEVCGRV